MSEEPRKYHYAAVLNALDDMQRAPAYALRREMLQRAEQAIVRLEDSLTAARARVADLEAAGRELVRLKALHDKIESGPTTIEEALDYATNKPAAWQTLCALLAPEKTGPWAQKAPCGECRLQAGETCDVCGAKQP